MDLWTVDTPGVLRLPSGRLVRGRGLGRVLPDGPAPHFGLYLQARRPPVTPWPSRWLRWRDFSLPADSDDARDAAREVWRQAGHERVEVACTGGTGRTGTLLACVAILDGVPPTDAVTYVREHYRRHAVETPWQRAWVRRCRP